MGEGTVYKDRMVLLVFVHGLLGFDAIRFPPFSIHYFRGLAEHLAGLQVPVLFPRLPAVGSVADRAAALAAHLASYTTRKIYIVAHSMGGLDSRYYIHHLDKGRQVRGLATVGTPHRGTVLASWFEENRSLLAGTARAICRPALLDLTPEACERFNELVPDRPDVTYFSYAGSRPVEQMFLPNRRLARYVQDRSGDNDGQVPVSSAAWGNSTKVLQADHFELVGWNFGFRDRGSNRPFAYLSFYEQVIDTLLAFEI